VVVNLTLGAAIAALGEALALGDMGQARKTDAFRGVPCRST
jgi:hypothetical protein